MKNNINNLRKFVYETSSENDEFAQYQNELLDLINQLESSDEKPTRDYESEIYLYKLKISKLEEELKKKESILSHINSIINKNQINKTQSIDSYSISGC